MKLRGKIRLTDVAKAANTSVATVSMALGGHPRISDATRRRVHQICRELGYQPRRAMPPVLRGTAHVRERLRLAFLGDRLDAPINAALLQALTQRAAANDVRLEIESVLPGGSPEQLVDQTVRLGRSVDGLMLMGSFNVDQLRQIAQSSVAAVLYGYPVGEHDIDELPVPVITSDFAGIGHRATRALIECGHRRIGFVSGPLISGGWHARALDGYATAHLHGDVELDRSLIFAADRSAGENSGGHGARAVLSLPEFLRPAAYVAINTGTAARFLRTMKDEGGITVRREDIVICGYPHLMAEFGLDDYPLVYMDPDKLVEAALHQLKNECIKRSERGATILVPFSTRNLPSTLPGEIDRSNL